MKVLTGNMHVLAALLLLCIHSCSAASIVAKFNNVVPLKSFEPHSKSSFTGLAENENGIDGSDFSFYYTCSVDTSSCQGSISSRSRMRLELDLFRGGSYEYSTSETEFQDHEIGELVQSSGTTVDTKHHPDNVSPSDNPADSNSATRNNFIVEGSSHIDSIEHDSCSPLTRNVESQDPMERLKNIWRTELSAPPSAVELECILQARKTGYNRKSKANSIQVISSSGRTCACVCIFDLGCFCVCVCI